LFANVFRRFPGIFIEKLTFEEFEEMYRQIYKDDKEIIDSTINLISDILS